MKSLSGAQIFKGFLIAWFLINLLQASFTQLDPDEAYYWAYSQELAWGYFDHPSFIAFLIKVGTSIFGDITLGVRFFPVLLQTISCYLLWLIAGKPQERKAVLTFILLLAAMPMLQVFSFIATPDAPLLFFATCYLYFYQQFLKDHSWGNTLLLGACMAAMLHSKYHGVLWIFFILVSNWRLLLNPRFYVAAIFGFSLFFPHLYWQYSNEFPSFRYHLSGRDDVYKFKYTTNYLLNQLLIFSPLLFPFIIKSLYKFKPKSTFEKSWPYLVFGFWGLFLTLTYKGHAEPQWTALLSLVFILLLFRSWQKKVIGDLWLRRMALLSFLLIMGGRIFLLLPFKNIDSEFHKKIWVEEVKTLADGLPVLFMDSYRDPSKYSFYAKEASYTLTDVHYRKNQYDLWDWEKAIHNQRVFIVGQGELECADCQDLKLTNRGGKTFLLADSFQVSQNAWIEYDLVTSELIPQTEYEVSFELMNPYTHTIKMNTGSLPLSLNIVLIDELEKKYWFPLENDLLFWNSGKNIGKGRFQLSDLPPGEYFFHVGIRTGDLFPCINSQMEIIRIPEN